MKVLLLTTIVAAVVVGCGPQPPDISIHEAAVMGNIEAVKQHLAAGTNVNAKDELGMTPLHRASISGHKEVAELLIDKGADVNAIPESGLFGTPLDYAIRKKHPETADLLRKHGGKRGDWFKAGESIFTAAKAGHIEAVKQHLAAGADVNAKTMRGETPLDWAIKRKHTETADLLRKHGGKTGKELEAEESIHAAARYGNIEDIKQHLAAGTDVDANNVGGVTPLHWAAQEGQKEIAELLIAKGASVNAQDVGGYTPLDSAIRWNYTETADLLRKHGGKTREELKAEGK
jgi:ankyrin repeat protein